MKIKDFNTSVEKEIKKHFPNVNKNNPNELHYFHDKNENICVVVLKKLIDNYEASVYDIDKFGKIGHCYKSTVEFTIKDKVLNISNLLTRTNCEKLGYATELLNTVESFAKHNGVVKITLYAYHFGLAGNLIDFYKQRGYLNKGNEVYKSNAKFKKLNIVPLAGLNFNLSNSYIEKQVEAPTC